MILTLQQRRTFRSVLCGLMFVAIFGYACMPRQIITTRTDWVPSRTDDLDWRRNLAEQKSTEVPGERISGVIAREGSHSNVTWSTAGFPFDAVHIQGHEFGVRYQWIGWVWVLDVFAAVMLTGGVMSLAYRDQYSSSVGRRGYFVSAASLLVLIGATTSYWVSANQNMQQLRRAGRTALLCSVRSPLFDWLPEAATVPWTHPYSVNFLDQERFQAASQSLNFRDFPSLQAIEISGGLSPVQRDQMLSLPLLHTLVWHDIPTGELLHSGTLDLPSIEVLDLAYQSKFSRSTDSQRFRRGRDRFRGRPRSNSHRPTRPLAANEGIVLSTVSLTGSDELTGGGEFDFRDSPFLKKLRINGVDRRYLEPAKLTSPYLRTLELELIGDDASTFAIGSIPYLQNLDIAVPRSKQSKISIEISEMPSLTSLRVPGRCPVSLTLVNVPKLENLESSQRLSHSDDSTLSGSAPWFCSLNIHDAPLLTEVKATVSALDSWQIEGCPKLRSFQLGRPSLHRLAQVDVLAQEQEATALDPVWRWLENDLPLNSIELEGLDLREVNLSIWKHMPFLSEIKISNCETLPKQTEQFADLPALTRLRAPSMRLTDKSAKRLLSASNRWERMELDWSRVNEIRIVDQASLISAFGKSSLRATRLCLKGLPRLEAHLHLTQDLEELCIEEMPKLQSLIVNGNIPSDAHVDGLQEIRCICFRKNKLDCTMIDISLARRLQTLQLPNCEISQELIDRLPTFIHLISLDLSGTRVQDEMGTLQLLGDQHTSAFGTLNELLWARFDGTNVGRQTVERVAENAKLRVFSLQKCPLDKEDLSPLLGLNSLVQLNVDPRIDPEIELQQTLVDESELQQLSYFDDVWHQDKFANKSTIRSAKHWAWRFLGIRPLRRFADEVFNDRRSDGRLVESMPL
ncbi:hypothetical protein SAMN06265222_11839 [Neorhodopirellula lusitana]|uniref:Uncharacterized protein n=1 Tax=Neorhodopirellula lusitana TaxID=445327 RepID=A0ABY1QNL9_9BACT|nr:hypothetical protein [Neorhodopirellula lusitana]SMP74796.1 hypothetical protein SAMN06265222_11839 [Neorhodopirellula lusitana]